MNVLTPVSLEEQLSKKISTWILTLVVAIITVIFFISLFLSQQMFKKQVNTWKSVVQQYVLTNLIDSDYFSVQREMEFIRSTGLFSTFVITDNQKKIISQFGSNKVVDKNLLPIKNETNVVWGYYDYKTDFFHFIAPFLAAGIGSLALILIVYFGIRRRIQSNFNSEFFRFNQFLKSIEEVIEKLHDIYNHEIDFQIDLHASSEQVIINKAIARLLEEIKKANQALREAVSAAAQRRFQEELTRTALQVTHDIGSPLATLEAIVEFTSLILPERERTAIRNAAGRIRDIANTLLQQSQHKLLSQDDSPLTQHLLQNLINQVISEKRILHKSIKIEAFFDNNGYQLFSLVRSVDFCRILSNLINNAIEAINESGKISISFFGSEKNAIIKIKDNGKGISGELLGKIGSLGITSKSQGHGIGLYHAIRAINSWNGKLNIQSKINEGTTVEIILPKAQPPKWFLPEITLTAGQTVVIVDDEHSIHDVWKKRITQFKYNIKLIHLYSPNEFFNWYRSEKVNSSIIYLCDYEFIGSAVNGIDLINQSKINYLSILVTSHVTQDVMTFCEINGIKLLPKDLVKSILIRVE